MARPQLLSGARGLIQRYDAGTGKFNAIAFATDISVNVRVGNTPTYVVGSMNPAVIDPTSYDVDVSVGRVIPMNAPGNDNPQSKDVTAIAIGLETIIAQMVTSEDLVIALQDKVTGAYTSSIHGCRFAGRNLRSGATDIGAESINFVGIYDTGYNGENASATIGYGV